jgi:hypothetical protein
MGWLNVEDRGNRNGCGRERDEMVCGVEHDRFAELIQSNRVAAGQHPGRGHFG